ncbi:DUF6706 family protein [Chitinophaga varians]|uniref:DUF6706 family protein n=1 Tax=Chitinophaga varians TaxID=2202339 RepID=UPI00165ED904|nr:DUF6706 family protein [Chitinophaga varians]MBC9913184.1 hypothetical protein [Chitinophaga varians]
MTNKEYLNTILGKFGVSPDEIDLIMLERGIVPTGEVTGQADIIALKRAIYYQLPQLLAGVQDITEGGYSIKWNLDGIKIWYSALAKELGLPDDLFPKPTITGASPW